MKNKIPIIVLVIIVSCTKNEPPTCQITSPNTETTFLSNDPISIVVEAVDPDGIIQEVRFFVNDIGHGSVQTWPYNYSIPIEDYSNGAYVVKAIAIDNDGLEDFDEITFYLGDLPVITTSSIKTIGDKFAVLGGELLSDGEETIVEMGLYIGTSENPEIDGTKVTIGNTTSVYSKKVEDLTAETKYYVKAFAKNTYGEALGNTVEFETFKSGNGVFVDIEGNEYTIVKIGDQWWMAENLKTSLYNDGTEILEETNSTNWENNHVAAYCWYDNDKASYGDTYGALYNFYAVETGNLCPEGWHVPSDNEWKTLEIFLGMSETDADAEFWRGSDQGSQIAGKASLWFEGSLTTDPAFNQTNFAALPGGYREFDGVFKGLGENGHWWPSTETSETTAWDRDLNYQKAGIYRNDDDKRGGISVRCMMDQ